MIGTFKDEYADMYIDGTLTLANGNTVALNKTNIVQNSFSLAESISTNGFTLGGAVSSTIQIGIILKMYADSLIYSSSVNLTAHYTYADNTTQDIAIGTYYVDDNSVKRTKSTISFTAYDGLIAMDKACTSACTNLKLSYIIKNLCCNACGVTLGMTEQQINQMPNGSKTFTLAGDKEITYRALLGYACELLGAYARINRTTGKLEIITLHTTADFTLNGSNSIKRSVSDRAVKLTGIKCNDVSVGTDLFQLSFDSNPLLEERTDTSDVLTNVLNAVKDIPLYTADVTWFGNLSVQAGDTYSYVQADLYGGARTCVVMDSKFIPHGNCTVKSYGDTSTSSYNATNKQAAQSAAFQAYVKANYLLATTADIKFATIETLESDYITAENISATYATIATLTADYVTATNIAATYATIATLTADYITAENISATYATITNLNAATADISTLNAGVANIESVLAGNVGTGTLQTISLTATNATVSEQFVKTLIATKLYVGDLLAGDISTDKFRIVSTSGKLLISDNTIQISDTSRVRVQIGKDANNDYNLYVWDTAGKLMFDAAGLKADGIKSGIIRNDMVAEKANINGSKIDISSLVTAINGNTSTINASKVKLDTSAQTLDVDFNSLATTVTTQGNSITSQRTAISVLQGQITSKVEQSDIDSAMGNLAVVNILPISADYWEQGGIGGGDGANVDHNCRIRTKSYIEVLPNTTYTLDNFSGSGYVCGIYEYSDTAFIIMHNWVSSTDTFTTGSTTTRLRAILSHANVTNPTTVDELYTVYKFTLHKGNTALEYWLYPGTEGLATQTEMTNKFTAINQTIDSISVNVSAIDAKITNDYSTTTAMNSAISASASAINLSVSQTYATQATVDGIQIGGRNLLLDSADETYIHWWQQTPTSHVDEIIDSSETTSGKVRHIVYTVAGMYGPYWRGLSGSYKAGDKITVSFKFKCSIDSSSSYIGHVYLDFANSATGTYVSNYSFGFTFMANTWRTVSFTATVIADFTATPNTYGIMLYPRNSAIDFSAAPAGTEVWVADLKIEKGNKSTDWTPAPEDVDSEITAVDSKFANYASKAELAITNNQISLKVDNNGVISAINQSAETISISASKININGAISANGTFSVSTDGYLSATGGTIGGFILAEKSLTSKNIALFAGDTLESGSIRCGDYNGRDTTSYFNMYSGAIEYYVRNGARHSDYSYDMILSTSLCTSGMEIGSHELNLFTIINNTSNITADALAYSGISFGGGTLASYGYLIATGIGAKTALGAVHNWNYDAIFNDTVKIKGKLSANGGLAVVGAVSSTGTLTVSAGGASIKGDSYIKNGYLDIANDYGITCGGNIAFRWKNNDALYVGISSTPLKLVGSSVTSNGSSVTSDRRKKHDIRALDARYTMLLDKLDSKLYKYNDYKLNTTNVGFIAQDVLAALDECGLTSDEFGGFVDVYGDGSEFALDYSQFIPILWAIVKKIYGGT